MLNKFTKVLRTIKNGINIYPTTIRQIASWYIGKYGINKYYKKWLREQIENELEYCKNILTEEHYNYLYEKIFYFHYNKHAFNNDGYNNYYATHFLEINGYLFCNPDPYETFYNDFNLPNKNYYKTELNYFNLK